MNHTEQLPKEGERALGTGSGGKLIQRLSQFSHTSDVLISPEKIPEDYAKQAHTLKTTLLEKYDALTPPTEYLNETLNVRLVVVNYYHLSNVDLRTHTVTVDAYLIMLYTDHRLEWDRSAYPAVRQLSLDKGDVWSPSIWVVNHVGGKKGHHSFYQSLKYQVSSYGTVTAFIQMTLKLACEIDNTNYPFEGTYCQVPLVIVMTVDEIEIARALAAVTIGGSKSASGTGFGEGDSEWLFESANKSGVLPRLPPNSASILRYTQDFQTYYKDLDRLRGKETKDSEIYPVILMGFRLTRQGWPKFAIMVTVHAVGVTMAFSGLLLSSKLNAVTYYTTAFSFTWIASWIFLDDVVFTGMTVPVFCYVSAATLLLDVIALSLWLFLFHRREARIALSKPTKQEAATSDADESEEKHGVKFSDI